MICFIVFTCLTLLCSDVAALHFTILPDVTSELTDVVDMNCSLGTQQVNFLYSIRIVKEGQSSPLATILTGDKTIVHDPSNSVAVNGHIDPVAPDTSYLHLRWSHPTFNNSGVYTCEITYLDLTEKTNSSKSVTELTVKRVDMHDIVRAIHHIRDQTTEREAEIETVRQENKNLQKQSKDMRETLNNAQRKSVERESIIDAIRKVLPEMKQLTSTITSNITMNTNNLKEQDQRLDTLFDNFNKLRKVNMLVDVNTKCPDGWKRFKNQCFRLFKQPKTWSQARDHCQSINAHLTEIPDAHTNAFIHDMIKGSEWGVWIGLSDNAREGIYVWDGSSRALSSSSYTNWGNGEPHTYDGFDYGMMGPNSGKWYMRSTTGTRQFICQKEAEL